MITLLCKEFNCTGCKACMNSCKHDAISFENNILGESVPVVNFEKCKKCQKCIHMCPQLNSLELKKVLACYAARRIDYNKIKFSASGGIGAVLIETFIEIGGSVFATAVVNGKLQHICVDNKNSIECVINSRYVQSDIGLSYKAIKQALGDGKKVLFIGTPCQVAAVKKVIGVNSMLFTVDLVCHGVPPQKIFDNHLEQVLGREIVPDNYTFRNGKSGYELWVYKNKDVIYKKDRFHDTYYCAFLKGLNHRTCCYTCKYATKKRVGDLTIGDFWGIKRDGIWKKSKEAISLLLINSNNGIILLNNIDNEIIKECRKLSEAVAGNNSLRKPMKPLLNRKQYIDWLIKTGNSEMAMKKVGIKRAARLYWIKNISLATFIKNIIHNIKKGVKIICMKRYNLYSRNNSKY